MEELRESEIIGREEWEMIAWRTAEKLFGVRGSSGKGEPVAGLLRGASLG